MYFHSAYPPILTVEMAVCMGWGNGLWSGSACLIACVLLRCCRQCAFLQSHTTRIWSLQRWVWVADSGSAWVWPKSVRFVGVGTVEYWISVILKFFLKPGLKMCLTAVLYVFVSSRGRMTVELTQCKIMFIKRLYMTWDNIIDML